MPARSEYLLKEALSLHESGKLDDAAARYAIVLEEYPRLFQPLYLLGALRLQQDRPAEAITHLQLAVALEASSAAAWCQLGSAHKKTGNTAEALQCYNRSIGLKQDYVEALYNRANLFRSMKENEKALIDYDSAISLNPRYQEALYNRGNTLCDLDRLEDALLSYESVVALEPRHAAAWHGRGTVLMDLDHSQEAMASFDRALAILPDYPEVLASRGYLKLSLGNFAEGFFEHEHRKQAVQFAGLAGVAVWRGEDVSNKSILVHDEQGFGDVIQFSRFLLTLASRGADVTFRVRKSMHRLLHPFSPLINIVEHPHPAARFDFQCQLMSLPAKLAISAAHFSEDTPYLFHEPPLAARWRERLGSEGFKIGICWQGNPAPRIERGRSFALRYIKPIAAIPGVRLISLQKNYGLEQLSALPDGMTVETLGTNFDAGQDAFVDTAAVMAQLDLIITSDTSVAHLAGALGRPVWVALQHVPDWRWLRSRIDSLWYPSMVLYRQRIRGEWKDVFDRIAADVAALIDGNKPKEGLTLPGSMGELFDKLSILDIKASRIADPEKLKNVESERRLLREIMARFRFSTTEETECAAELMRVNEQLWDVENRLRRHEALGDFSGDFVALARSVYRLNDRRAELKKDLNKMHASKIVEEKSYH